MISFQRLCPEIRRSVPQRGNNASSLSSESPQLDFADEDGIDGFALKRRQTFDHGDEPQKKFTRLLNDLTRSLESPNNNYEIRQIQQQITIETPLAPSVNTRKLAYGKQIIFIF